MKRILPALLLVMFAVVGCAHRAAIETPKLAALDKQIAGDPKNAQAFANRGYALALLGDKPAARADLKRAVELNGAAPMLNQVGWAYFNLGDAKEALRVWTQAADLSKRNARYDYYSLALGYWANRDVARALENYDLAAKRDERFADWKSLVERTAEWTDTEKREIQAIYTLWSKTYRPPQ